MRCNRCFLNEAANSIGLCGACANLTCDPMDKTLTDTRRAEVEALAEKLFIAMWADYPLTQQCDGSFPDDWDVAAWSFNGAEAWLAERDRRREKP